MVKSTNLHFISYHHFSEIKSHDNSDHLLCLNSEIVFLGILTTRIGQVIFCEQALSLIIAIHSIDMWLQILAQCIPWSFTFPLPSKIPSCDLPHDAVQ